MVAERRIAGPRVGAFADVGPYPSRSGANARVRRRLWARACGTYLGPTAHAQAGAPLAQIRDLLGHSTIKVTERYAHLAPENARGTVKVLEDESRFGHVGGRAEGKDPVLSALTS